MTEIKDFSRYTQLMRNGYYDKLFFLDKLFEPWETFVDYGCAEGWQTKLIASQFADKQICGYDNDPRMITAARYTGGANHAFFTDKIETVKSADVILLSSVVHEVYSYGISPGFEDFWKMVYAPTRKYVIIRDMMIDTDQMGVTPRENGKIIDAIVEYLLRIGMLGELRRFEEYFLPLDKYNHHPIIHFLLKLPYITSPNWDREIHESYVPLTANNFKHILPEGDGGWRVDYEELYTLPYLKHWWRKELGVEVPYHTHGKFIFYNTNI